MATYFLDTSAVVKRYVPAEQGHAWIVALCDPAQGHKLYISQAALVEVVAAMCRKAREQSITTTERDMLIDTFRQDSQDTYAISLVTTSTYTSAGDLCRSHSLRAYDAVQLASVLSLWDEARANQVSVPTFVCADNNLINVASEEGLGVENPNNYS
jgi:predicted nucleic acid-binding protein